MEKILFRYSRLKKLKFVCYKPGVIPFSDKYIVLKDDIYFIIPLQD